MEHAKIAEEMIERQRGQIGVEWKPREPYYNTQARWDTIRHFCHGLGDDNPLFTDPAYAARSSVERLMAPPSFLYSVFWPFGGLGMPGIHAWHSGNDWEFYYPILEGDEFTYTNTLTDVVEKESQMAGRTVIQYADTLYYNHCGIKVAKARGWSVWASRADAGAQKKYGHIKKATYTAEELEKINAAYENEEIRGSRPRFWEDVEVGDPVGPIVKGPLSLRDIIAATMGGGSPFMRAHKIAYQYEKRHPAVRMLDSETGELDVPELVHMQDSRAQEIGIPGAYDYGWQRISWLINLLTNWMGDDGFLKRLYAELRMFNVEGDTTWLKGKVTRKYAENGEYMVDIECWGENQRGDITMPGRATVILPSKEHDTWPVLERVRHLEGARKSAVRLWMK